MAIFLVPIFSFLGCGKTNSYSFSASVSDATKGGVEGFGTYTEGSKVTLTATANSGSSFVAWVFQEELQLSENDVYTINYTTNEERITSSSLSFVSKETTQGNYTAIFEDNNTQYAKLASWKITSDKNKESENETSEKQTLLQAYALVSQGKISLNQIYESEDFVDVKENVEVAVSTDYVLKLDPVESQTVIFNASFVYNNVPISPEFRTEIKYHTNSNSQESNGYSTETVYDSNSGTYKIIFGFKLVDTQYYLILNYKNINKF